MRLRVTIKIPIQVNSCKSIIIDIGSRILVVVVFALFGVMQMEEREVFVPVSLGSQLWPCYRNRYSSSRACWGVEAEL